MQSLQNFGQNPTDWIVQAGEQLTAARDVGATAESRS